MSKCIHPYYASDMKLHIDTDAAYLVLSKELITTVGFYHLTNTPHTSEIFFRNGAILVECKISESEVGVVFQDTGTEIPTRNKL